jgi:transcriptional regulator with XRE-family HTH domain
MDARGLLESLGAALREVRADARLSQEELSLMTGVHRNYIGGIERAERNPTVLTVARLADALGISMSELFTLVDRDESREAR